MPDPVRQIYPEGVHETAAVLAPGECFGIEAIIDVRAAIDPATHITVTQWLSEDGGATWVKGASCAGPGDPMYAAMAPRPFRTFHTIADRNGNAVARWNNPLVKHTIEIRGPSVSMGVGDAVPITRNPVVVVP